MIRRQWLVGVLGFVTAIAVSLGLLQGHSSSTAVAQSPAPAPSPIPSLSAPSPAASPTAPADPAATPAPTAAPTPLPVPTEPVVELEFEPLPLSGNYEDDSGLFQVGILEGFTVSRAAAAPLFESGDGHIAYTVAIAPIDFSTTPTDLSNEALVRVAERVFGRGEGFRIQSVEPTANNGTLMEWLGSLTVGGATQPMQGSIIAQQAGSNVVLLLIAATDTGAETLTSVTGTLAESLEIAQG
ncbi:MAG: hypothetical protein ACTS2F_29340 [Thainema sp.]